MKILPQLVCYQDLSLRLHFMTVSIPYLPAVGIRTTVAENPLYINSGYQRNVHENYCIHTYCLINLKQLLIPHCYPTYSVY